MTTFKRIKKIASHVGHARFLAETDGIESENVNDWIVGYLATVQRSDIPSPYAYSPVTPLYRWRGKLIFISETSHRVYEVFEVPATMKRFATDEEATEYHIRMTRRAA